MAVFCYEEAREHYALTENEHIARRIDNSIYQAKCHLIILKRTDDIDEYIRQRDCYFKQLAILKEYGIYSV